MSQVDKQALRTYAENANQGEWCSDDHDGVIADAGLNGNYYIAHSSGPDNQANARYIAAANPSAILALLDELDAAEKRIAELEARTVTLPPERFRYGESEYDDGYVNGWNAHGIETKVALRAAGIGVKEV
ncbi:MULTISPECIES: ead/Ea22-like family protein [Edwardsiella]|uniref:Ead/Ea22-like family protein n=2 Tax=Edwardsiella anguillarum TaxID=1821960 RepID=A0A076LPM3_9GAMM|nr:MULTISPECIES: ead/Ea22-like family protein [Edwardsiella]AIJ10565.1 Hypothetical protein ETEE_4160 [Edwardsiella anguillarum ET080813]KAB0587642.1 ead/Ea22-like family protein [Edwardsiella anguillarum]MDA6077458.1 ead/Ea22-like family protein [Edwardsiella anguillarum]UBU94574.1 ead/Ea22-like family protein [Edwardsiella sp. LADL05-105]WHP82397.1 ead/Ea22-like family protein [Edwardsiella anguillarum]